MQETTVRRWRDRLGLSQAQAAAALGLSLSQLRVLDTGTTRRADRDRVEPDKRTLLAMAAIARGIAPWSDADA